MFIKPWALRFMTYRYLHALYNSVNITLIIMSFIAWNDYKLLKSCWL